MRRKERKELQEYNDMRIERITEMIDEVKKVTKSYNDSLNAISESIQLINGLQEIKEKIDLLNDSAQAQIEAKKEITEARKDLESRD